MTVLHYACGGSLTIDGYKKLIDEDAVCSACYPAAGLLRYFSGGVLVLINKSETPADRSAQLMIREPIGVALGEMMRLL